MGEVMDIKGRLTQKVGPLPLWAWGAIGIGLIIVFSAYKRGDTTTTTAATDSNSGVGGGEATFSDANGTYPVQTRERSNDNSGYGITDTASVDSATGYASDVPWTTLETTPPQTINNYYYNDNPTPGFVNVPDAGLGRVQNAGPNTNTGKSQVNAVAGAAAKIVRPQPKPKPKPKPTSSRPGANSPHRNPTPTKPPNKTPAKAPAKKPAAKKPAPKKPPHGAVNAGRL